MPHMARRSQPAPATWATRVREAYASAHFSRARALYDEYASTRDIPADLVLLRARISLVTDPPAALDLVLAHRGRFERNADRLAAEILLASSFAQLRDYAAADTYFERARLLVDRRSFAQGAALAAARGRRYVDEARIGDAWRCYEATLVDRRIEGRIESESLKAEIHRCESRFGEEAASLTRLLALLGETLDAHLALWYRTVSQLAQRACELPAPAAAATVAASLVARPIWSQDFSPEHFETLRSLAWCKALSGDALGSFRYLREAGTIAESLASAPLRAIVMLDRAQFARNAGEGHWSANEAAAATDLLRDVDWLKTGAGEHAALPLLAEVLAPTDPEGAAAAIARHCALATTPDPTALAAGGVVHLANGRTREGVRALSSAFAAFDRNGSEWRAGKAAIALARTTGETRWRLLALEKLEFYAASWLYAQAEGLAEVPNGPESVSLTPMQERVFNMICEGLSTDAIAARLGRSHSTVRNHIKLIFKTLGVRSRAALVAQAARTGRFTLS